MSPLVTNQVADLRANFDGKVIVVEDFGDTATVLIVPREWMLRAIRKARGESVAAEPVDDDDDWARVREPMLLTIDPAKVRGPKAS